MLRVLSNYFHESTILSVLIAALIQCFMAFSYHQILFIPEPTIKHQLLISTQISFGSTVNSYKLNLKLRVVNKTVQFEYCIKMKTQGLQNSSQNNSSAEISISTAQSQQTKHICKQENLQSQKSPAKRCLPRLELSELNAVQTTNPISQEEEVVSSRLFTFMDEKEAERKIIQDYVFRQSFKKKGKEELENKKSQAKIGLIKMIQDSRKKREDFFKKITVNPTVAKNRSTSKIGKTNRSKTPRNTETKYETLQPRSRSKTPKFQVRYSTPKHQFEPKLFRAKSNLGQLKGVQIKESKGGRQSVKPKKRNEEDSFNCGQGLEEKELLKKKKQLERQLQAVNGSLLELKKIGNNKKKSRKGNKTLRGKSKSKMGLL